jgi:uridylate kinase
MENGIPIVVFNINGEGNLKKLLVDGEDVGTLVTS